MLFIWSKEKPAKVRQALDEVLRRHPKVEVGIGSQLPAYGQPQPTTIFILGNEGREDLAARKIIPKNRTITSMRTQIVHLPVVNTPVMFSYSPGIHEIDYGKYVDLLCDTTAVMRLHLYGKIEPKLGDYKYVPDFSAFLQRVDQLYADSGDRPVDCALDLETLGLDPYLKPSIGHPGAYIVTIQLTCEIGKSEVVRFPSKQAMVDWLAVPDNKFQLNTILTSPKISLRGANLKYDLHWIAVHTKLECTNFRFDTTLVGSLLDENRSNALDVHAKIYTPLGGYCVAPETRIWKSDLTWCRASEVVAGDELVGFDEHTAKKGKRRLLQRSEVVSTQRLQLPCWRVKTTRGKEVVVSSNHAWLCNVKGRGGNLYWVQTNKLYIGQRIKAITDVTEKIDTFEGGWASGFLDGEGHLYRPEKAPRLELGWAQLPTATWAKAVEVIGKVANFSVWTGKKSTGVMQAKSSTWDALKILQAFRPARLLDKNKIWGISLPQEEPEFISGLEYLGVMEVVSMKTSTHTFVAEGLASHNSDYFDRHADKSRMDLELAKDPEGFITYAGGDTDACLQVSIEQKKILLKDPQLTGFYVNILHPAARAFEMVERGGVLLDMDAYNHLESEVNKEIDQLLAKGKAIIGGRLVAKHRDLDKRGHLNLTKASLLIDFMFSPSGLNLTPKMFTEGSEGKDDKTPSVALEHLLMFKDHPKAKDFVGLMAAYGSATKTMSTYITGFKKHIRSDGRFHPSYYFFAGNKEEGEGGTNTGRTSCRDPAFQTIPKHTVWAELIRRCYIAPPGYFILENDYSQGELRIMACVANELTMIQAYLNGMDLHSVTSGRFAGYSYEEMMKMKNSVDAAVVHVFEEIRQLGKAGNFGLIYGMSAGGFHAYAESNYGVKLADGEAEKFRNGFFDTYTALPAYHERYKAHARLHGYVRSPLGRVRHLPLIHSPNREKRAQAERQAINAPIQSTLSDLMIWAIGICHRNGWFKEAPVFGMVHDAGYTYIPQDNYLMYAKRMQETMENLPLKEKTGWEPQLKFIADGKFGLNMWDLQKVKY